MHFTASRHHQQKRLEAWLSSKRRGFFGVVGFFALRIWMAWVCGPHFFSTASRSDWQLLWSPPQERRLVLQY